jgi:hypothetical protein
MVSDAVVVNFRIPAQTRKRLRILLLEEGMTIQEFFASLIEQKFESIQMEITPGAVAVEGDKEEASTVG